MGSFVRFQTESDAAPKLAAYMERIRSQILAAVRGGMREAMNDLAEYVVETKLSGNPIGQQAAPGKYTKPGDLAESILAGVRVSASDELVRGTLSGRPKSMPNLGLWQEFGTNHAERFRDKFYVFVGRDGSPVFTRHIKAFTILPRPFLNPSLEEQKAQIIETIRTRLAEAKLG